MYSICYILIFILITMSVNAGGRCIIHLRLIPCIKYKKNVPKKCTKKNVPKVGV